MQHASVFFFFFLLFSFSFVSLSLSLPPPHSLTTTKKNACTRTPNFLVFLKKRPHAPSRLHTQIIFQYQVLIQTWVPGGAGAGVGVGVGAWPQLGTDTYKQDHKQCVTTLNTEWLFPLGPEKTDPFLQKLYFSYP